MQYTHYGWYDDAGKNVPYLLIGIDNGGKCSYAIQMTDAGSIEHCCTASRPASACEPPSLADLLALLVNLSLGQRATTPQGQNLFIDRCNKTFFQPSRPIAYDLTQENVSRMSSLANYIHIRRWDKTYGAIESLYEEYLIICGNIAYSLLDACKRYLDGIDTDLKVHIKSRKHNLVVPDFTHAACNRFAKSATPDTVAKTVEGAMLSCAIRDHSEIQKDKANIRLRSSLEAYRPFCTFDMESAQTGKTSFGTKKFFDYLESLADASSSEFYLVCAGCDEIVPFDQYCTYRNSKYDIAPLAQER